MGPRLHLWVDQEDLEDVEVVDVAVQGGVVDHVVEAVVMEEEEMECKYSRVVLLHCRTLDKFTLCLPVAWNNVSGLQLDTKSSHKRRALRECTEVDLRFDSTTPRVSTRHFPRW